MLKNLNRIKRAGLNATKSRLLDGLFSGLCMELCEHRIPWNDLLLAANTLRLPNDLVVLRSLEKKEAT